MDRKPSYEELSQRVKELESEALSQKKTKDSTRKASSIKSRLKASSPQADQIYVAGINIEWKRNQGICTFEEFPVAMMWIDTTLAGLMSGMQAMVGTERFMLALQSEGRKSVEADWQVISRFPDFREGFKAISNIAAVAGWGDWQIVSIDEKNRECRFRAKDSWEGRYQKSMGVCWGSGMLAGKMAGYCSKLFGTNCWAEQTQFIAKGDNCDEFVVKPTPRLLENEIENMLASDEATRADMAVALKKLEREVSERKRTEETLRDSERKARAIFDLTFEFIGLLTPEGSLVEANRSALELAGVQLSDVIGKPFWETPWWTHSTEMQNRLREAVRTAAGGELVRFEATHCSANGTLNVVDFSLKPVKDETGQVVLLIPEGRDVTERKMAEEALRESEKKFRDLAELLPLAVFEFDLKGSFTYVNLFAFNMFGYSLVDLEKGLTALDMIAPSDRHRAAMNIMKIMKKEMQTGTEYMAVRKNGEEFPVIIYSTPILAGEEVIGLRGIVVDITARKQAENLYRTLADSSHAGVFIAQDGIFQFVNPHIQEYSGYSEAEIVGSPSLTYVHPDDREITRLHAIEMLKGKRRIPYEYRIISRNGDTKLLIETVRSITYGGKKAVLGNTMDITERYQMEGLLRQAQKMESIGTLAGGIAHDFNNILGAILGYTEMALANQRMDDRQRHYLEQVFRAAERARDLVKQILTFSRQKEQEKKPVLIASIIKEGIKLLRSSLPTTIKITQSIKDTSLMVLADPTQIHQVVMNLCTNASHAMRERGGVLDIQLCRERIEHFGTPHPLNLAAGDYAKVTVSDTGHGIDANIMDRIFDPFFTTKGPGEGTGLGLSVVYGIVNDHGGSIGVSSELGRGTTITVYFPLIETEEPIKELVPETIPGGSERILFIDDEATLAELGSMLLTSLGYDVTTRTSSIEALEAFRAGPYGFDLVITDMTMPNMRGDDLARELLKIRPDIPIILCTGFSEMISAEKAKNLGIRRLIMKPVSKKDLAQAIHDVLDTQ